MTKEQLINLLKRKIKEHEEASNENHKQPNSEHISTFESGCVRGLEEALSLIGMLGKEKNRIKLENS